MGTQRPRLCIYGSGQHEVDILSCGPQDVFSLVHAVGDGDRKDRQRPSNPDDLCLFEHLVGG